MATSPAFISTPNIGMARISTANTNRDGTGTLGTLVTGATNGTRIDRIVATAISTTTAGMLRFFLYDATNTRLVYELAVTAIMPSGTVVAWTGEWVRTDGLPIIIVPSGWILKVGTNNAESFDVVAVVSGDF